MKENEIITSGCLVGVLYVEKGAFRVMMTVPSSLKHSLTLVSFFLNVLEFHFQMTVSVWATALNSCCILIINVYKKPEE